MEEEDSRETIQQEAADAYRQILEDCRQQENDLITTCIQVARRELEELQAEIVDKKDKNEVELAAFQIAQREMQGEVEVLKDDIQFYKQHQKELERLAKLQQLEEKQANSLKKLMWSTFSMSSPSNAAASVPALKPQQEEELARDHPIVMRLCASIFKMEQNRQTIAAFISQVTDPSKNNEVKHAVEQIEDVLDSSIVLNEDALNDAV
ncbi:hypothetical protein STCU_07722 [Strigomonas culicis]|nr:hypothetical protein STCU_07722 [Strigomonas culicis]|eukprot:EPY23415.1 hypothetical protein STCU_07722 [Strigomonas culicis]